jgi:predicted phage terminase large subunit-like protein
VLALDPSKGKDAKRSDYSAYVWGVLGRDNSIYVDADIKRRDTSQMIADGVEHVRMIRPDAFAVECNQYQELLAPEFIRQGREQRVYLPIVPVVNTVNKQVRIRRLGPYFSQRRIRVKRNSPGAALLIEQLRDFPAGAFDDGADRAEMMVRTMEELLTVPVEDDVMPEATVMRF